MCLYLLDSFKVRNEEVCVVVRHRVLQDRDQSLQPHSSINALLRQRLQLCLGLSAQGIQKVRLNQFVHPHVCLPKVKVPLFYLLNWINTRFQISSTLGSSMLTRCEASLPPMRSQWISLQGPQGPVSPISQKLSFMLPGRIRSSATLTHSTDTQQTLRKLSTQMYHGHEVSLTALHTQTYQNCVNKSLLQQHILGLCINYYSYYLITKMLANTLTTFCQWQIQQSTKTMR